MTRPVATPRSRLGLSREAIVAATDRLLRERGLGAVTMREVAQTLGIGTMTLYGYFADKDELLDAVIDANADRLSIPRSEGPWKPRLRELMLALHHQLVAHPFLIELRLRRPLASPGAFRWTEAGLQILREVGLSPEQAAHAFRPLFIYTFGHATFLPRTEAARVVEQGRRSLAALAPEDYPVTTAAADHLARSLVGLESYEAGLGWLLDGIEHEYVRGAPPPGQRSQR